MAQAEELTAEALRQENAPAVVALLQDALRRSLPDATAVAAGSPVPAPGPVGEPAPAPRSAATPGLAGGAPG
jgi:hypothetical protein